MKVDQDLLTKIDYLIANHKSIPSQYINKTNPEFDSDYYIDSDDKKNGIERPRLSGHKRNYVWLLDAYEADGYEGSGERIGIDIDKGKFVYGFTSHCSCNSPWEEGDGDNNDKGSTYIEGSNTESTYKQIDLEQKEYYSIKDTDWSEQLRKNVEEIYQTIA